GQDGKGVVLVAGGPPGRAQGLDVVAQGDPLGLALRAVAAVEVDQLPLAEGQVQAGRGGLVQPDGTAALVFQQGSPGDDVGLGKEDRKSTRLNSSHVSISYAVFCLKKKKQKHHIDDSANRCYSQRVATVQ